MIFCQNYTQKALMLVEFIKYRVVPLEMNKCIFNANLGIQKKKQEKQGQTRNNVDGSVKFFKERNQKIFQEFHLMLNAHASDDYPSFKRFI